MTLWHPFRKPEPPRLIKRIVELELRAQDTEDSIEKVLYQQQRLLGKITARQKKELQQAELALDAPQDVPTSQGDVNGLTLPHRDLKAQLRARANELRRR